MEGYVRRYIEGAVARDLKRKMVFIGGPRQAGKTTLGKRIGSEMGKDVSPHYMNWDDPVDRENVMNERFPAGGGVLILDEVHKYNRWRQVVKGLYDKRGDEIKILVTGSARLDFYRRGGDSLQGRYHYYHLFPLSLAELDPPSFSTLEDLMAYGGFPEPFLLASENESRRWSREYRTRIVRDDLRDLERVQDLDSIERMSLRLPELVGAPLSLNALREDLHVSHASVSRWLGILENLYVLFRIYPFGSPGIRAVKKEAKHYHLDWTLVRDEGKRFENLVACHLLKWCRFLQDSEGRDVELRYFRDVDRREVDFVLIEDGKPFHFVECKSFSKKSAPGLMYLRKRFPGVECTQIVRERDTDLVTKEGVRISSADIFLRGLV